MGQGAQIAKDTLFRVVPDGAGVQHDDVGLVGIVSKLAAHGLQHAHDVLAVRHILLAAEGVHQGKRGLAALTVQPGNFPLKFPLAQGVLRR